MASHFNARVQWSEGHKGGGVHIALLDSGMPAAHKGFGPGVIFERTDWTEDGIEDDLVGHGTFVGGVMAGNSPECMGFAPEAHLHSFRVFNRMHHAYTSWFIDAMNYAMVVGVHIVNLSVGGPDWMDRPFVDKVIELSANGVIVVSANGNDGPHWGTTVNPADMLSVIGVGGAAGNQYISAFSSRGMTKHELRSGGYGRVKPDLLTFAERVHGPSQLGGCTKHSGTSVASPIVAGTVALLASTVPAAKRWQTFNPGVAKQILIEGATPGQNKLFEEGAGLMDLQASAALLGKYEPRASLFPAALDWTESPCIHSWPWCTQPLFHGAFPTIVNVTLISGIAVRSVVTSAPRWHGTSNGDKVVVDCSAYSAVLWPWSGWLGIKLSVPSAAASWSGTVEGTIILTVSGRPLLPPGIGGGGGGGGTSEIETVHSEIGLPIKISVVATPARERRILWDQVHSISFPPAFIPKDSFEQTHDFLDWHADHPHTNFKGLYEHLRSRGFFVDILTASSSSSSSPSAPGAVGTFESFDALNYTALLLVDPEEEYGVAEAAKLRNDVTSKGLSLLVFADWFSQPTMASLRFLDDNTHRYWTPVTSGCNVPALNELLGPLGVELGVGALGGEWGLSRDDGAGRSITRSQVAQGVPIRRFPSHGRVVSARLTDATSKRTVLAPIFGAVVAADRGGSTRRRLPPIPKKQLPGGADDAAASIEPGLLAVYGDSNCVDSSHLKGEQCFWLLDEMLAMVGDDAPPAPALVYYRQSHCMVAGRAAAALRCNLRGRGWWLVAAQRPGQPRAGELLASLGGAWGEWPPSSFPRNEPPAQRAGGAQQLHSYRSASRLWPLAAIAQQRSGETPAGSE